MLRLLSLLGFFLVQILPSWAAIQGVQSYHTSKVGCISPLTDFFSMECLHQRISFDILDRLSKTNKRHFRRELQQQVMSRAHYYLKRQEFDYQSVLALMVFPVKDRQYWLRKFSQLPGERVPYAQLALQRLDQKIPAVCQKIKKEKYFAYREICELAIYHH